MSLRCLVQIRSSILATNVNKIFLETAATCKILLPSASSTRQSFHSLNHRNDNNVIKTSSSIFDEAEKCLPSSTSSSLGRGIFHNFPLFTQQKRWEEHWSQNFEKEEMEKRRFSNEGHFFRSVFTRKTGKEIWKGVTTQSKAAMKSGRGKRGKRMRVVNLNKGQSIGVGPKPMQFPGLNARLNEKMMPLPVDPNYASRLLERQNLSVRAGRKRQHPLERGWTSNKFGGRKLGPPDPRGDQNFDEFETYILEFKRVCHMEASHGRTFSFSCMVVVGNGNGLAGYAVAKAKTVPEAQRKAKNQAILKLQYVKLYNDHTIFHKIYSKYHASHLYIEPRPKGHGVRAHRVIATICKALGLKDLWVTVEKSDRNYQAITKGFFSALRSQKDIQQLADEMRLHVVEYRQESDFFPTLISSPRPEVGPVRRDAEVGTQEYRDLDVILNKGQLYEFPFRRRPPYTEFSKNYLMNDRWKVYKRRNQEAAFLQRQILYSDQYPEEVVFYNDEETSENEQLESE